MYFVTYLIADIHFTPLYFLIRLLFANVKARAGMIIDVGNRGIADGDIPPPLLR